MKKIRKIDDYKDTVRSNSEFFKNYYYHSIIDSNLIKLECILKYGILSKKLIERNNLIKSYTHQSNDFDSKNGSEYISLSEYSDKCEFSQMFESFSLHTLTSLSLLVDRDIEVLSVGDKETYFDDEIFVKDKIDRDKISGIILPSHLSNQKVSDTCFLANDLSCYTKRYINNLIDYIESYFNKKIDREKLLSSLKELHNILEEYESPERWVDSAHVTQKKRYGLDFRDELATILNELWSERINISNPNYLDIVKYINNDLPIYEIGSTLVKK